MNGALSVLANLTWM